MIFFAVYGIVWIINCIILIATSIYGIQGSRISQLHLSLFTVYGRVLHIIKVTRYYIDMQIIFWIIVKRDRFFICIYLYIFNV